MTAASVTNYRDVVQRITEFRFLRLILRSARSIGFAQYCVARCLYDLRPAVVCAESRHEGSEAWHYCSHDSVADLYLSTDGCYDAVQSWIWT